MPDRFPKPWKVVEHEESFSIRDANEFPLAFVYFTDRPSVSTVNPRMTRDQARRIAKAFAKVGQ